MPYPHGPGGSWSSISWNTSLTVCKWAGMPPAKAWSNYHPSFYHSPPAGWAQQSISLVLMITQMFGALKPIHVRGMDEVSGFL